MFISLIQRIGTLQVNRMLIFTADQGRRIIDNLYPSLDTPPSSGSAELLESPFLQSFLHSGRPRIIQEVDISALVEIGRTNGYAIELAASIGDTLVEGSPILHIFGVGDPVPESILRPAIKLGRDRIFEQDPKYAIRLLVDIAIKALSPAINDPTTAVQTLDQIEDLLIHLGRRRLEIGAYRDMTGNFRLLINFPTWEDFLRLAFDEIRFYGATSIQVMRRMKAVVNELLTILPEERRPALRYWQERLRFTVESSFGDNEDKLAASAEDPQGLGSPRRTKAPGPRAVPNRLDVYKPGN